MESTSQHQFNTEEEFKAVMDPIAVMVRTCTQNGEDAYFNAAARSFFGVNGSWSDGIHPDFILAWKELFFTHGLSKKTFKTKYRFKQPGGTYRWMAEHAFPWYMTDGVFVGFVCYVQDIDELVDLAIDQPDDTALEHEQALNEELAAANEELSVSIEELQRSQHELNLANSNLEQILNMLPASVVVIRGPELVVEMINDSNLDYWNRTKEEVLGRPFLEILPDLAGQPFAGQLRRVMETGEIIDVKESPVIFIAEDGSVRETFVDYTYQPLSDLAGNRTGVLVMSFEITDRVLSKRLLEQYAHELALSNSRLVIINKELVRSEARFKYLINEAPVAIGVLHGRDLVIESANGKILEVWGKSRGIIGLPLHTALPEIQGQPFLEILDQVYTTGKPFSANEIRALLEHDGELKEFFFNVTYQPISDGSESIADILVVAVDVTQQVNSRKQVEQSAQHFRQLADLVPAKISNALPTGEVTFFNRQWLDFASMDFEDMRDFGYHQMMHPEEIPAFHTGLAQAAANGIPHVSEMRFKNTEGKYVWHLNIASPVFDEKGMIKMWVGSTTDIQSLKAEEQRKSDFVSMLSHELKTPVTSIKGHVQLALRTLDREAISPLGIKLRPSLARIDRLLLQLTGLIGDMLDLTRLEAGRLDLRKEAFRLDVLVSEVVEDFKLNHQQHYFHLITEKEIQVVADRHKISQVLINLISNAVKYAPDADVVDIIVISTADEILITVRDYGIGIDQKDQQKIFERFYRVEGKDESFYNGFGIGLFLVNSIVGYHGGRMSLESSMGKGSSFTIHLPHQ